MRLTPAATTAWASVTAGEAQLDYFAQPHGANLFGQSSTSIDTQDGAGSYLPFFAVQAGALPKTNQLTPVKSAYPLAPYAGAKQEVQALDRMEVQVLCQERRAIIHEVTKNLPPDPLIEPMLMALKDEPPCKAGTPQGLIAEFQPKAGGGCDGSVWQQLTLARSKDGTLLSLEGIVDPLRSALLTPQQFLVASDPSKMDSYIRQNNEIHI